ncbi:ankyrin repeat domain-containing protein [Candidatus Dependentiae bacterium]|nr:ankyrin repeat domain-containing protein [Candidatus Dependentiae bacterium]
MKRIMLFFFLTFNALSSLSTGICSSSQSNQLIVPVLAIPIDKQGNTELHYYAAEGNLVAVTELINSDYVEDIINSKNFKGSTPLHIAVSRGDIEIVKKLIEAGANISERDAQGRTAQSIAEKNKRPDIEFLLIGKQLEDCFSD